MKFYQFGEEWEFYDLENDPDELTNQYNNPKYADKIAEVRTELDRLQTFYDDDSDVAEKPKAWQERNANTGPVVAVASCRRKVGRNKSASMVVSTLFRVKPRGSGSWAVRRLCSPPVRQSDSPGEPTP